MLLAVYLAGIVADLRADRDDGRAWAATCCSRCATPCSRSCRRCRSTFFNQNKAGDLISRINNDTDKLNQFFSQGLMQFVGNVFMMTGAAIFLLVAEPPARARRAGAGGRRPRSSPGCCRRG